MAAPLAMPAVLAALVGALKTDTGVTALLATVPAAYGGGPAVYGENAVPQGAPFPYVTVGAPTELPFNNFGPGAGGSNCTVQVKAFSRKPNDDELFAIMQAVQTVLDAGNLIVDDFSSADCEFDSSPGPFQENVAGLGLIRQLPVIYRVYVSE